jgi:penicillin-binding protein 2
LGERVGLHLNQETGGDFPSLRRISSGWGDRNTANLSIGQDPIFVTPLQVAVLISAIANGGKVLQPRLVDHIEPTNPLAGEQPMIFPYGQVRDHLGVSRRSLDILYRAMLADTEDADGTGRHVRDHHPLPGLRIAGKTGTAQVQDEYNRKIHQTTWFASFATLGSTVAAAGVTDQGLVRQGTTGATYAVVVMVEDGKSGGDTCSPVAGEIYAALQAREQRAGNQAMARSN